VIGSDRETAFHPTLQILNRSSGAVVPWASFPMGHGKDHNLQIVCTKNDVERKSTKNRSAEVSVENLKAVGRIGEEVNTRSNSSRNRTAARTLRSAYQATASSASCCAAGWKLTDLRISR
jgi:hypothetical protein